ncbi:MAG: GNAT family N-acetyltransferase [Acidobacteriota bacterium]|nr:GNAT family N-acetyltransferase [Acidobacteriota bacterium]
MTISETERLNLRKVSLKDAGFILRLLNEPSFLRFIGDKGVRTLEDARNYIVTGPIASYERHGFGLWLVELRDSNVPIGICGLLKRDSLPDVDVGFAFLPRYWSMGYAYEAASAALSYGTKVIGLKRMVAITNPDNVASIKLLEKLGLRFESMIELPEGGPKIKLFAREL